MYKNKVSIRIWSLLDLFISFLTKNLFHNCFPSLQAARNHTAAPNQHLSHAWKVSVWVRIFAFIIQGLSITNLNHCPLPPTLFHPYKPPGAIRQCIRNRNVLVVAETLCNNEKWTNEVSVWIYFSFCLIIHYQSLTQTITLNSAVSMIVLAGRCIDENFGGQWCRHRWYLWLAAVSMITSVDNGTGIESW